MNERCVEVQLRLAHESGAVLHTNEEVVAIDPDSSSVTVTTPARSYQADNVVLSTGPWIRDLAASEHAEQLTVTRQVVFWFDAADLASFTTDTIPYVMWIARRDEDYIGLFPMPPGGTPAVKIVSEQFLETTDPSSVDRTVSQTEIDTFYDLHVAPKFSGVRRDCVRAEVCLYVNTADDHFLIDSDPRSDRITLMSPCSGHGFKHSTAQAGMPSSSSSFMTLSRAEHLQPGPDGIVSSNLLIYSFLQGFRSRSMLRNLRKSWYVE